jgi:proteasome lid subunit RPN8/RPN11
VITFNTISLEERHFDLYFTSEAFLTLLGPIIENYEQETGGVLVGSVGRKWIENKNRPIIVINSVFPSVTAKSTTDEWEPDEEAIKRIHGFVKSFSLEILGEYHSHPNEPAEVTEDDEEYIYESYQDLMKMANEIIVDNEGNTLVWIEVVIRIKRVKYKGRRKRQPKSKWWTPIESGKLRGKITINSKEGFDITIGAHAFFKSKDKNDDELLHMEIPIYSEVCSSHEA